MNHSIATHNGTITIHNPATGNHRTFRIRTQKPDANFAAGQRIVALLTGSDNESSYTPFGFVHDTGAISVWVKRRGDTGEPSDWERFAWMLQAPRRYEEQGAEYLFATKCRVCNRKLTDPVSINLGIGPTCRGSR